MNFNDITAEAFCDYGITFWERLDHHERINGYTVERNSDKLKASMLHTEGRTWRGAFGQYHTTGTKAKVANWAVNMLANAD